jgi:peptidase
MSIARQYGTTVDALCKLNNIRPTSALKPGQNICYRAERKISLDKNGEAIAKAAPVTKAEASVAGKAAADNSEDIDVDDDSDNGAAVVVAPKASKKMTPGGRRLATSKQIYYRVRKGDTLKSIARRYGMTVNQLCRINGLRKTSKVKVGRSLRCS